MAVAHEGHGRHHGVILNANGQIVAHVWGHVKVTNPDFRYVPGNKQAAMITPQSKSMTGLGAEEEMSLF